MNVRSHPGVDHKIIGSLEPDETVNLLAHNGKSKDQPAGTGRWWLIELDDVEAEEVELDWRSPSDNGGASIDEYRVEEYRNGRWRTEEDEITRTRYDVEDRDPYTRYSLRVRAHNRVGWSDASAATAYAYRVAAYNYGALGDWSSTRSVTTAATPTVPGQVTELAVAPGMARRLALSWAEPSDTGGGVTGYQVERTPDETPRAWATVVVDTGSAALSWGDNAVAADTVVHYRVSACNSAGVGTATVALAVHVTWMLWGGGRPRGFSAPVRRPPLDPKPGLQ